MERGKAPARALLAAERTAAQPARHLSAWRARRMIRAPVAGTNCVSACTRKTTPGGCGRWKIAVRCGGGFNHRFGLRHAS